MNTKVLIITLFTLLVLATSSAYTQHRVVPPSPGASSLGQQVNSPVSLHTGTMNVDIPLWVLNSSKLSTGVSLSYYGAGFQPGSKSEAGYNWSLNAGGVISRTIRGVPDEQNKGWLNSTFPVTNLMGPANFDVLEDLAEGNIDDMPDIYYFSFPGYSGKFLYDKNNEPVLIPFQHIDIQKDNINHTYTITTPEGMIYSFGGTSAAVNNSVTTNTNEAGESYYSYYSEWYLTNITTPDLTDNITFSYEKIQPKEIDGISEILRKMWYNGDTVYSYINITKKYNKIILKAIEGKNSSLEFDYGTNYKGFTVKNASNEVIRKISFSYSQGQLMSIVGHSSVNPPIYFEYNGNVGAYGHTGHWGYHNGVWNRILQGPEGIIFPDQAATRKPNAKALDGILTKINFPSGGYKEFEYELHTNGTDTVGGARIRKIKIFDNNQYSVKRYLYEDMRFKEIPEYEYTIDEGKGAGIQLCRYSRSFENYPLGNTEGSHVSYGKVTVLEGATGENGKTVIYYSNDPDTYGHTEEYPAGGVGNSYPYPFITSMEWKRGLADSVLTYRKTNKGFYVPVNRKKNFYVEDLINRQEISTIKAGYKEATPYSNSDFIWQSVKIISGRMLLDKVENYDYERDGVKYVKTQSGYFYKSNNNLLEREEMYIESENKTLVTHILYPEDYTLTGTIGDMYNRNILTKPVEIVTYSIPGGSGTPDKVLSGTIFEYDKYGRKISSRVMEAPDGEPVPVANFRFSNQIQDGYLSGNKYGFSPDTRYYAKKLTVDLYKNGKSVQLTKDSLTSTTLYAYNYAYPVAKIINAKYNDVTAIIPETDDLFTLDMPDDSYVRNKIDVLRDSLPEAMITSNTYGPVYGNITSATDMNGISSYYEYDTLGRVETIKGQDMNIVKHFSYDNSVFHLKRIDGSLGNVKFSVNEIDEATKYVFVYYDKLKPWIKDSIEFSATGSEYEFNVSENITYIINAKAYKDTMFLATSNPVEALSDGISLSAEEWIPGINGGELLVYIQAVYPWEISNHDNDSTIQEIIVSPTEGSGGGSESFTITCSSNYSPDVRSRTLYVTAGSVTKEIQIHQQCACPRGTVWKPELLQCVPAE